MGAGPPPRLYSSHAGAGDACVCRSDLGKPPRLYSSHAGAGDACACRSDLGKLVIQFVGGVDGKLVAQFVGRDLGN
jgi:hypothetical protein